MTRPSRPRRCYGPVLSPIPVQRSLHLYRRDCTFLKATLFAQHLFSPHEATGTPGRCYSRGFSTFPSGGNRLLAIIWVNRL